MALPRYERDRQRVAGPRTSRLIVRAILTAALIGLCIGIVWVIVGILHFHPLW